MDIDSQKQSIKNGSSKHNEQRHVNPEKVLKLDEFDMTQIQMLFQKNVSFTIIYYLQNSKSIELKYELKCCGYGLKNILEMKVVKYRNL